jgi:hypothetical protein
MNTSSRWTLAVLALAAALVGAWILHGDAASTPHARDVAHVATSAAPVVGTIAAVRPHRTKAAVEKTDDATPASDAPEDAPTPPTKLVRFLVKTREDKPIAGARIDLTPKDGAVLHLVTGEDGTAKLPSPMAGYDVSCEIRAKGFVTNRNGGEISENGDEVVELDPARRVAGHVFDSLSDAPIAGAQAQWWYIVGDGDFADTATTDVSGAFAFDDFPSESSTGLRVHAPGHVGVDVEPDRGADAENLVFRLDPGGRVAGVVRRPDDTPAAEAYVSVDGCAAEDVRTDAEGRYVFDGLTFGKSCTVVAWSEGFARTRSRDPVVVTRDAPEAARDLVLAATATLVVSVVDDEGKAVPSAHIHLCDRASKEHWVCRNEHDHVFEGLDLGALTIVAWTDDDAMVSVDVEVAEGETKHVEVKLTPRDTIDGIVVDDTGAPVPGETIDTVEKMGCSVGFASKSTSDADGTFHLRVAQHIEHELSAGDAEHRLVRITVPAGADSTRIVLQREATVRFRLRPQAGSDVPLRIDWEGVDDEGHEVAWGRPSRNEGEFDLAVQAALTTRRITIRVDSFLPVELPVHPEFRKIADLGDVVLDPGATVRVRAVDADGHPVPIDLMHVNHADYDSTLAEGTRADDGSFVARGIPPGPARVLILADYFLPATVPIEAAVAGPVITVTLKRGAVLRVRVVDADGFVKLVDSLSLRDASGNEVEDGLGAEAPGIWKRFLPAARYHVVATSDDVTVASDVELAEGATKDLTLKFARK